MLIPSLCAILRNSGTAPSLQGLAFSRMTDIAYPVSVISGKTISSAPASLARWAKHETFSRLAEGFPNSHAIWAAATFICSSFVAQSADANEKRFLSAGIPDHGAVFPGWLGGTIVTAQNRRVPLLLGAQRDHRVHARGAACRHEAGRSCDCREQCSHRGVNKRIERVHLKENVFQGSRCQNTEEQRRKSDPDPKSNDQLPRSLPHDHLENPRRVSPQRHANAKFLRALVDREAHHP